jgi:UDP-glucose:(glucosyl)LPS alpha-1,2-glucosyltransferase
MGVVWNEISKKSNGGTEIIGRELEKRVDPALMDQFQIFPSRVSADLDPTKIRLLWAHDSYDDPMYEHLKNEGYNRFHRLVFVSHNQKQGFQAKYNIPASKCVVMPNAIVPIEDHQKPDISDGINLIYTSTPQRGLNILGAVFNELCKRHDDLTLSVYSSFRLYGWENQDEPYKPVFEALMANPKVKSRGTVPNEQLREALKQHHIFAYSSTWPETSCLCLLEAMSAGLVCVHSDLGALYETASNLTLQYPFHEDPSKHANAFLNALEVAIDNLRQGRQTTNIQKPYVDAFYNWDMRAAQWTAFLESLLDEPRVLVEDVVMTYRFQ